MSLMRAFKLLFTLSVAIICSSAYSKVATVELCEKIVSEIAKDYPKKRKTFTAIKPECIKDSQGHIFMQMIYSANKNNEPADDVRDRMIEAASANMRKLVCNQKEFSDLLQFIDVKFSFKVEENDKILSSFNISYEECKLESSKALNFGSDFTQKECQKYVESVRNQYPKKTSEVITVSSVGCRNGILKPIALVYFNEINVQSSPQIMAANFNKDGAVKNSLKNSYCNNSLIKGMLQTLDILNIYTVKQQEIGEITITSKDCD